MTDARDRGAEAAQLQALLSGAWTTQVVYVAAELGIADLLSAGPRTSHELAGLTGSHQPSLERLLQALTRIEICTAESGQSFALTPLGDLLRSDAPDSLHSWSLWWGRSLWNAWGNLLHSVRTGESARALVTGTRGFDHLAGDPEAAEVFYRATVELSRHSARAILDAYDFSPFSRIVDVGGGYGELLASILSANPAVTGILFELPQAVDGARKHLDKAGLGDRCEVVTGDFFSGVPSGADLYLLKSVLHDWTDERAREILSAVRRSLGDGARLLVIEQVLPERGVKNLETGLTVSDLTMLVAHGSGERTGSELEALLHSTSLEVVRRIPATPTLGIIEVIAAPDPAAVQSP